MKRWLVFAFCLSLSGLALGTGLQHHLLKNGLQLVVKEDHRAPVVFFSIWYKVGSSYESDGITGIAHVVEHMMFRGTQKYPAGMLEKIISDNGGQQNAMTAEDWTVYFQSLSVNALPISFQLESDRMQNLLLTPSDFNKEIQVVMEERRMRVEDDPEALTYERLIAAAQINNPYHHPTIGWMTDLQHLSIQDVTAWYHRWYVPNNAVIVVVGDVQPKKVLLLAKKYFGHLKSRSLPILKPRTEIDPLGMKQVEVTSPAKLPALFMGYQTPSVTTAKQESPVYALAVLAALLGGYDSARFSQHLIRGKQMASTVQASYDFLKLYGTQFVIQSIPMPGHSIQELQNAIEEEIAQLQAHEVSEDELKRAKTQVIAQNIYKRDSPMTQAIDIGIPVSIGLSPDFEKRYTKQVAAVTAKQVQAVVRQYLTRQRLTVGVLNPVQEKMKVTASFSKFSKKFTRE